MKLMENCHPPFKHLSPASLDRVYKIRPYAEDYIYILKINATFTIKVCVKSHHTF